MSTETNVDGAMRMLFVAGPGIMDIIWQGEFVRLFQNYYPDVWYIAKTQICPSQRWKRFRDSAKVRFCCERCCNGWTSMKGRVVFWYTINWATREGFVQYRLYGQVCRKCGEANGFQAPMWYPEEVSKVLSNLYNKIGQLFYGFTKMPVFVERRKGKPRTQHNSDLCQACKDGECWNGPGDA